MNRSTQTPGETESVEIVPFSSPPGLTREPFYLGSARYPTADADDSDSSLLEYWNILRRHKYAILFSALSGLIVGFLVGIPMKPVFRARTSLEVLNINEDFMNMKQSSPTTTNDNSYDTSEEQTQAQLLQSSALLERVFAKLDPDFAHAKKAPRMASYNWRAWFHLPEPVELTERQKLLSKAAASLKVRATLRTRLLEVTVDSTNPQFAATFVNTLVQEFVAQSMEARLHSSNQTTEWLNREIDDARTKLQRSENALQAYARDSGLIFTDDNTNVATEKLQQLQAQLSNATVKRITRESRFELARTSPPDALPDILQDEGLQETRSKRDELRRQIADLSAIFNPEYSKVKRLEAELVSLQANYDNSRADVLKSIENDYRQAVQEEKLLSDAYVEQAKEVVGQSEKEIQYNILKREADSNRQLYDTMLQQTKQAAIASAMRASNVRIVDPAEVPSKAFSPDFKLNSLLGLAAGLFLSISFVTLRDRADRALQQPGDVKQWTDLAELGTIPTASLAFKGAYGSVAASAQRVSQKRALSSRDELQPVELITWEHKSSMVAEAFRSTLTSLLFIGENGSRPRVLVFTSSNPADGKTTIVSNLAISTAEIRRKVLVIDADLRRPRMHNIFNLSNESGLTDLLQEEFSEERLAQLIQETSIPGLHVITGGSPTQAAAHLLYSPNFGLILDRLRKEYDMIMIDTPPMLQMTDARVAARLADAVVLVARAGQTTRDAVLAMKDRFAEDRIRVLGTVLNNWDPERFSNGYYSPAYSGRYYNRYTAAE